MKNANTAMSVIAIPITMIFIERSFCVLMISDSAALFFLLNSFAARPTADLMTPNDFTIPMIPAVAIPPIPMCLA